MLLRVAESELHVRVLADEVKACEATAASALHRADLLRDGLKKQQETVSRLKAVHTSELVNCQAEVSALRVKNQALAQENSRLKVSLRTVTGPPRPALAIRTNRPPSCVGPPGPEANELAP